MRIEGRQVAGGVAGAAPRRAPGAAFSLGPTGEVPRAASPSAATAAAPLAALAAIQGEMEGAERRRRAVRRGKALLDDLDRLKVALLSGRVSPAVLASLRGALERREMADDPALADLLAQIELRAEVELAKLGR